MDIITKVLTVKSNLTLICVFALISFAYSNYTISSCLLFITLGLFADIISDKDNYLNVEIKKIVVLGLFFLLSNKEPIGNFIATAIIVFIIFRMIYLFIIIKFSKERNSIETFNDKNIRINSIKFLPSFGISFFILGLYLEIIHTEEPDFLFAFKNILKGIGEYLSESNLFWICFLALWILFEFIVKKYKEHKNIEIIEGIGMGDVIILSFFAGFLGITLFIFVVFLGCIIHILQYFSKNIQFVKGD